ncbi:hypothetical protein ACTGJ9_000020 [Bradyrhizobium sp. RDM12]
MSWCSSAFGSPFAGSFFFFVLIIGLRVLFRVDSFGVAQALPCEASSSLNADRRPKELLIGPGEGQGTLYRARVPSEFWLNLMPVLEDGYIRPGAHMCA